MQHETLTGGISLLLVEIQWPKGKKNWKEAVENPWCNCKHTEVSFRKDLSKTLCGKFKGIAFSLGNLELTLGSIWIYIDLYGSIWTYRRITQAMDSAPLCEVTHWPLRPGFTLSETLLLGKENFRVHGQREHTALASPVTIPACDGIKFLMLGLVLCFS